MESFVVNVVGGIFSRIFRGLCGGLGPRSNTNLSWTMWRSSTNLHITDERFGSSSDLSINGHLHYPNDVNRSLNEVAADKIY